MIVLLSCLVIYFLVLSQAQRTRIKECINSIFDGILNLVEDTTDDIAGSRKAKSSRKSSTDNQ